MDDIQIVNLYLARQERAIEETHKKYGKYCHYIAYQILQNNLDAEEIVNDTYLRVWNTVPPNKPDPLKGYVGKISNNLAINRYREKNTQKRGGGQIPLVLDELSECVSGNNGSMADDIMLRDALNRFIGSLPDKTRKIFVRRYWYASSFEDIARDFKMRENAAVVLMYRTRKKLAEFLEKEGFDL